ncbi:MAG: hypothetical protein LLF94_00910, partial [Chlamydiales bacterium]|nr:hypothetical protein [Chlamydiales bacterium]
SIAHLSDAERMFFVTLLLNECITWMRQQPGTSSLRALLYMDEIFGYFPPSAMPPSKLPMLTLLKQARAYGLGIVLVTQNPVDLDYKGLANCGTWFIGKLQTERDKMRVIEGLNMASNGELDSKSLDKMIAQLGNRVFLLRSIYQKEPTLFETRWTMSYLRGPLTLNQIAQLTPATVAPAAPKEAQAQANTRPTLPPGIIEYFATAALHYTPKVFGTAKLHYVDSKNQIDYWDTVNVVQQADEEGKTVNWDTAETVTDFASKTAKEPTPKSTFEDIPPGLLQEKTYTSLAKTLATSLYQTRTLKIYKALVANITSNPGETEGDFRARVAHTMRETRDDLSKKVQAKYADKINTLNDKIKKAQIKVDDKQNKSFWTKVQTGISVGVTVLGALLGRGKISRTTVTQAGSSLKKAGQISKDSQDAQNAQDSVEGLQQQLATIQKQMDDELAKTTLNMDPQSIALDTISISPRKSDISVEKVGLIWWPK